MLEARLEQANVLKRVSKRKHIVLSSTSVCMPD